MEQVLTIVLWLALAFVIIRTGCATHATGRAAHQGAHRNDGRPRARTTAGRLSPDEDTRSVTGATVHTRSVKPRVRGDLAYHDCSRDCRETFEAARERYLLGAEPRQLQPEHSHA